MIVGDMTEDYEAMVPYQALGMIDQVDTVSPGKMALDTIQTVVDDGVPGWQTFSEKLGHRFPITADIRNVSMADYDALIVPGGRAPEHLQLDRMVVDLVRETIRENKVLASICHGPLILAAAGVLKGRTCTAYEGIRPEVELAGCNFIKVADNEAVADGQLVTAPTWAAHPRWLARLVQLLSRGI